MVKSLKWFICKKDTNVKRLPWEDHQPVTYFDFEQNEIEKTIRRVGLSLNFRQALPLYTRSP